jgi:hypothetical protein
MWDELVRDRGGTPVASLAEAGAARLAGARFVAVLGRDDGVLPAVAALEPAQAVAHLTLGDTGPVITRAADANRFLERLLPGIEGRDRFLLIPRFLYARTERAYDYAALVPELKRERVARLEALDGLDAAIIAAVR